MAGETVRIISGESRLATNPKNKTDKGPTTDVVGNTWGYEFEWTLRSGAQTIEQHQYMEFRYVNLVFSGGAPKGFNLSAWKVTYEWDDTDSYFTCSNATLQVRVITEMSGNIFRLGIFLDFVWLTTRTPHGAYVRRARRNRLTPMGVELNGARAPTRRSR